MFTYVKIVKRLDSKQIAFSDKTNRRPPLIKTLVFFVLRRFICREMFDYRTFEHGFYHEYYLRYKTNEFFFFKLSDSIRLCVYCIVQTGVGRRLREKIAGNPNGRASTTNTGIPVALKSKRFA